MNNRSLIKIIIDILLLLFGKNKVEQRENRKQGRKTNTGIFNFQNIEPLEKIPVQLVHHVDGDTEKFRYKGKEFRARLLMVDTPETVKEDTNVMPIGKQASEFSKKMEENASKIEIAFDRGEKEDQYGRYLVYVYIDGKNLQELLLEKGYAIVRYVNPPNNSLEMPFKKAEDKAKKEKIGVWGIHGYVVEKSNPQHSKYPNYMYNEKYY
jgi:micrococcal nuclease